MQNKRDPARHPVLRRPSVVRANDLQATEPPAPKHADSMQGHAARGALASLIPTCIGTVLVVYLARDVDDQAHLAHLDLLS
jgi:hypothetical protein